MLMNMLKCRNAKSNDLFKSLDAVYVFVGLWDEDNELIKPLIITCSQNMRGLSLFITIQRTYPIMTLL